MTQAELINRADDLEEMGYQILNIVGDMERLLRGTGHASAAQSYWIAHIRGAISGRGSMFTVQDTVKNLREEAEFSEEQA